MAKTKTLKSPAMRPRRVIKQILTDALRQRFPHDTVDISDGYQEHIHVVVVSREFDEMSENEKQQVLWKIIDKTDLTVSEKDLISLIYPVSPAEIKETQKKGAGA
jgi:acid stress-induced BolA-like protein IbaG/YrbA